MCAAEQQVRLRQVDPTSGGCGRVCVVLIFQPSDSDNPIDKAFCMSAQSTVSVHQCVMLCAATKQAIMTPGPHASPQNRPRAVRGEWILRRGTSRCQISRLKPHAARVARADFGESCKLAPDSPEDSARRLAKCAVPALGEIELAVLIGRESACCKKPPQLSNPPGGNYQKSDVYPAVSGVAAASPHF